MIKHTFALLAALTILQHGNAQEIIANDLEIQRTNRPDGREQSTYTIVHDLLKQTQPKYAYKPGMNKKQFKKWQNNVKKAMEEIMCFPEVANQPAPRCISSEARDGYTLEKWEFYPLPQVVSSFLVWSYRV